MIDPDLLWEQILLGASNSSLLELVAVLAGFVSVWYARNESILTYPIGLINVGTFVYICAEYRLYADMSINIYYVLISIYGWYNWSKTTNDSTQGLNISASTNSERFMQILIATLSAVVIYFILSNFTDSDVALWDSITTGIFIVAMILMARKKIDHWLAWIVGNLISIPLYLYKGLAFTSLQYLVFTVLAISGYIRWSKSIKNG